MNRQDFFTSKEQQVADLILFKDGQLLGSQANPKMLFTSDFDFLEQLPAKKVDATEVRRRLQQKVREIDTTKNVYLGDVKIGQHENGEPMRWTKENILHGKHTLIKALNDKNARFKIDMIAFIPSDGRYHEFTNIILRFPEDEPILKEVRNELLREYQEKLDSNQAYKAVKRLFSYYTTFDDKENEKEELLNILNNPALGRLHQMNEGLTTLIYLLENHKIKLSSTRFINEVEGYKQWLWEVFGQGDDKAVKTLLSEIREILKKPSLEKLRIMSENVANILNSSTKTFLQ